MAPGIWHDAHARHEDTDRKGDWGNWMTPEDMAFRPILDPFLEKYGYDAKDWQASADPVVAPAHCTEYFFRLVTEARATNLPFRGFA